MYTFFDTETNGFLKKLPPGHPEQSRCVQLAAIMTDENGLEIKRMNRIVKPTNWFISPELTKIHGISMERAMAEGVPIKNVLEEFENLVVPAKLLCAHNFVFDDGIMRNECTTEGFTSQFSFKPYVCTMQETTNICKIPKSRGAGYKWPKLAEAYQHFFGKPIVGAHDALVDMLALRDVFFAIKRLEEEQARLARAS